MSDSEYSLSWEGLPELAKAMEQAPVVLDQRVEAAMKVLGQQAVSLITKEFTKTHRAGTKTPATPGEPPAVVTGNLKRSIQYDSVRRGFGDYKLQVGPTALYGRALELGMSSWGGVKYPYVAPAAGKIRDQRMVEKILTQAVRGLFKGGANG